MKKFWILAAILLAIFVAVFFYFGFYTYFIHTEINEELPGAMATSEAMQTIAAGTFGEIDIVHKGSGTAKLIESEGKTILRFEDFNVTNGPDLYVYLSDSAKPTHNEADLGNYVNLGVLKASSGNQNYEVPAEARSYRTALIWCKEYSVLFSFAVMQ